MADAGVGRGCAARGLSASAVVSACVLVLALAASSSALAAPLWRLSSRAAPTNLPPGATGLIVASADNLGDTGVKGSARRVTISDVLPQGLDVTGGMAAHSCSPVSLDRRGSRRRSQLELLFVGTAGSQLHNVAHRATL